VSEERIRIDFCRSGGVAGVQLKTSVDTENLPPEEAEDLRRLVQRAGLTTARDPAPQTGRGADRFQYDLSVARADERVELSLAESEVTPEIRALLDALVKLARRRRG